MNYEIRYEIEGAVGEGNKDSGESEQNERTLTQLNNTKLPENTAQTHHPLQETKPKSLQLQETKEQCLPPQETKESYQPPPHTLDQPPQDAKVKKLPITDFQGMETMKAMTQFLLPNEEEKAINIKYDFSDLKEEKLRKQRRRRTEPEALQHFSSEEDSTHGDTDESDENETPNGSPKVRYYDLGADDPYPKGARPKEHKGIHDIFKPKDPSLLANALAKSPNFRATIQQLCEDCKLKPAVIREMIDANSNTFVLKKEMVELRPQLSLCLTHMEPQGCKKRQECKDLHVCQNFVMNSCNDAGCLMGHNWHTRHNTSILQSLHLQKLETQVLHRLILSATALPSQLGICHDYNKGKCEQENCQQLHVCAIFVSSRNVCSPAQCHLSHNLLMPECKQLLEAYGIDTNEAPRDILLSLLEANPSLLECKSSENKQNTDPNTPVETVPHEEPRTLGDTPDQEEARNSRTETYGINNNPEVVDERKTIWTSDPQGNVEIPEICVFSVEGDCEYEETGCRRLHSSQHFYWQVSESGTNWLNLMPLQVICLERAFCNPAHDGSGIPPLNRHNLDPSRSELLFLLGKDMWIANFQAMVLTNSEETKFLYIRRLSSEIIPGHTVQQSIFRWFRCAANNQWIQYPDEEVSGTNLESDITSEGLESQYLVNPNTTVSFKVSDTTYIVDFNNMTETEEGTQVVRSVRRRPQPHLGQITEEEREAVAAVAASLYQEPDDAPVTTLVTPDWGLEAIVAELYDQDEQLLATSTQSPQEGP